jgi:hypothetical protein
MSAILVITPSSILHGHLYYYSMEDEMMVDGGWWMVDGGSSDLALFSS